MCNTLYSKSDGKKYQQCISVYDAIIQVGLSEQLNFILSQSEKIIQSFELTQKKRSEFGALIDILKESDLNEMETLKDVFIDDAFRYERDAMV